MDKAVPIDPSFKNGYKTKLRHRAYFFLLRHKLTTRVRTRVSRTLNSLMLTAKRDYCLRVITAFYKRVGKPKLLCNMDQTPLYMNFAPNRTVHHKGEHNLSIRTGGSSSARIAVAVTVAMDGSKFPLFYVFKCKTVSKIRSSLDAILQLESCAQCKQKAWMDAKMMSIWYEKVWKPYATQCSGQSILLLDDYACHKATEQAD